MAHLKRELVYPFPAVQYIPLMLQLRQGFLPKDNQFALEAGTLSDGFPERFAKMTGNRLDVFEHGPDEALIAAANLRFKEVLYRAYYVTILAEPSQDGFVASFPTKYFYKTPLVIQACSETGNVLASCGFKVPVGGSRYIKN